MSDLAKGNQLIYFIQIIRFLRILNANLYKSKCGYEIFIKTKIFDI